MAINSRSCYIGERRAYLPNDGAPHPRPRQQTRITPSDDYQRVSSEFNAPHDQRMIILALIIAFLILSCHQHLA